MPSLTIWDRKQLLGPTQDPCPVCKQPAARAYCRSCDEFYLECGCPFTHSGHRIYTSDGTAIPDFDKLVR